MSTVYDAIMWIFGRDANRNIARQNNGPNDQIVPRHAGRDNNLAMVLYQQLVQDDAQPKDYLIAACYFLQIVAFFTIITVWLYTKIKTIIKKRYTKSVTFGTSTEDTKIMESIIKEGGIMSKQQSSNLLIMQQPPAAKLTTTNRSTNVENLTVNASAPPSYTDIIQPRLNRSLESYPQKYTIIAKPSILDKNTDVDKWLAKVDAYIYGNNAENKIAVMLSFINEDCLEILEEANIEHYDYEGNKEAIKRIFRKEKANKADEKEFYNRKQQEGEGYELYHLELSRLAKKVFTDVKPDIIEDRVMVQFVNGLNNKTVKQ